MSDGGEPVDLREHARGLVYIHERLGDRILEHQRLAAHVYALTEALIASGMLDLHDLERRREDVERKMIQDTVERWEGAQVLTDRTDKYTVDGPDIDCASRVHLCKAACCRMTFFLSKQDLGEHVVRWEVTRPYQIRQKDDGHCFHHDEGSGGCTIHARRPLVCRNYDCREDPRVWEDFEARVPSPKLDEGLSG